MISNTVVYEDSDLKETIANATTVFQHAHKVAKELNEFLRTLDVPSPTSVKPRHTVEDSETASTANEAFRSESCKFNAMLSKTERQSNGIYFTPKPVRDRLFEICEKHGYRSPKSVLEPSAGSGEFVYDAAERWPTAKIYAVEKHHKLYASLKTGPRVQTIHSDFLLYKAAPVEVIIGNPPYFVTKEKQLECMTGRGNIYVQFIYKCLTTHLVEGGVLAFILPTSFYNCSYYEPCRKYMMRETTILHLENLDAEFYDTAQDTMLMVVRRGAPAAGSESPYFLTIGDSVYLSPHYKEIQTLLDGATSAAALGLSVKTGDVVWNQHKSSLSDSAGTPIVYSSNIENNKLVWKPGSLGGEKKQYIQGFARPPVVGPAVVIGRGYGNKFAFAHCEVPAGTAFYGENHVNVITGPVKALRRFKKSLEDPRTSEFLRMFVGNGALSKSEIETLLPVF